MKDLLHRTGAACLVALLAVQPVCAAGPDTLESALRKLSAGTGSNYIVADDIPMDQSVPTIENPEQLSAWLSATGLRLHRLDNGDLLITRAQSRRVDLSSLRVEAEPWAETEADEVLDRVASATRIDGSVIEQLGDTTLDDLFLRSGNVFGNTAEYYVRGIPSQGDLNTLGNASTLYGDVPVPQLVQSSLDISTWDLQSVEFQRGARSTDSPGPFSTFAGGIRLEPARPEFKSLAAARIRRDDLGNDQQAVMLNRALVADELAVRLALDRQSEDGRLTQNGSTFDGQQSLNGRIGVLWEPAALPGWQAELQGWAIHGDAGPQRLGLSGNSGIFDREGRAAPFRQQQVDALLGSLDLRYEAVSGDLWHLQLSSNESDSELDPIFPLRNTPDPEYRLVDAASSQLAFADLTWRRSIGPGELTVGVSRGTSQLREEYSRDRRDWVLQSKLQRSTATLGYQWALNERWTAQSRVRYARDRLSKDCISTATVPGLVDGDCFETVGFLLIPLTPFEGFADSYDQWSPELGLSYRSSPDSEWFVHGYQGYNAGGAFSSAGFSGQPFWIFYQPEESRSVEAGWNGSIGPRFRARTTLFYTTLDKQWTAIEGGISLRDVTNSGRSRSIGMEVDGNWRISDHHRLGFSLGWLDTHYVEFTPFERDALIQGAGGNVFPGAPEYSGSLHYVGDLGPWQLSAGASFYSDVQANANNAEAGQIDGAALLDLQLSYRFSRGSLGVYVRNALDAEYHETTPDVSRSSSRIDFQPGDPRAIGLVLNLHL
ncbi:MAG: TonB-dependent receptor [Xanthomonadales bacterium]|nr:TonB-dependent receptor [Xanthomonadales bacterium]